MPTRIFSTSSFVTRAMHRAADILRKNGLRVQCTKTIMRSPDDKAALAREVLAIMSPRLLKDKTAIAPVQPADSRP